MSTGFLKTAVLTSWRMYAGEEDVDTVYVLWISPFPNNAI
jgi:hypothetical protein